MAKRDETPPLTIGQAAERLNISRRTVYDLCRSGKLPHYRIGIGRGTIRIAADDIAAFLEACRVGQKQTPGDWLAELRAVAAKPAKRGSGRRSNG